MKTRFVERYAPEWRELAVGSLLNTEERQRFSFAAWSRGEKITLLSLILPTLVTLFLHPSDSKQARTMHEELIAV